MVKLSCKGMPLSLSNLTALFKLNSLLNSFIWHVTIFYSKSKILKKMSSAVGHKFGLKPSSLYQRDSMRNFDMLTFVNDT